VKQRQFLDVVDEQTAHERFDKLCQSLRPRILQVPLDHQVLGRVLAEDVRAPVDVPGFDRSNVDGFAVKAKDTYGAEELKPITLNIQGPTIAAGDNPGSRELKSGSAIPIATGAVIPRGADAVVMVEDTHCSDDNQQVEITRASAPGSRISWAGTDLGRGELVLYRGQQLSSRETGLLAAIGVGSVKIIAPALVAIASTGDEIIPPGAPLLVGQIYDSNSRIVADAVREAGGQAEFLGIIPDDEEKIEACLRAVLTRKDNPIDILVLSGGTSKGAGDLNAAVIEKLAQSLPNSQGIVVHGVALKPGKPLCLAGLAGKAVTILPGFPTSAIFTFHEFIAPLVRTLSGRPKTDHASQIDAILPLKLPSIVGRTQYSLVNLVRGVDGLAAYPLGSGSGSVSTFSRADGFVRIDQHTEYLEPGSKVSVQLLSANIRPADLVAIGSHCVGLDLLLGALSENGFRTKAIVVGSTAGLNALSRGEGDIAGTHLLDEKTGQYNKAFVPEACTLIKGYSRRQGLVFRKDDERFAQLDKDQIRELVRGPELRMVNRNRGSGTRILIDKFLGNATIPGYQTQARSHHAVAASVAQGRADWGVTLDTLAKQNRLGFVFLQDEHYDFAIPSSRLKHPAVLALQSLLTNPKIWSALAELGFQPIKDS
jgi:putative molybdopterin biosynthesis protein